jgi:hypothetical protein
MTGQEIIALAGVLSGAAVGAAGILSTVFTGKASRAHALQLATDERAHTRLLARDDRVFGGRSRAYEETLRSLHRRWFFIERTHPVAGPTREPPAPPTDEELLAVEGVLGAFGSEPVRQAGYDFGTFAAQFRFAAGQLTALVDQGQRAGPMYADAWDRMDGFRNQAREKLREIEAMIQNELTQP